MAQPVNSLNYGLDNRGIVVNYRQAKHIFHASKAHISVLKPIQLPIQRLQGQGQGED